MRAIMHEMTMETFYIINQIPKINRAHWNLPWMSCILKFRSSKISLETLEHFLHRGEKIELAAKHHGIYEIPPFLPAKRSQRRRARRNGCFRRLNHEKKARNNSGVPGFEPWPLRYQCSALTLNTNQLSWQSNWELDIKLVRNVLGKDEGEIMNIWIS